MTDPTTGRSRGFGFVEMESMDAAHAAMAALEGMTLEGQMLKVNEAKLSRGLGAPRGGGERPSSTQPERAASSAGRAWGVRLFVGNLPYTATAAEVTTLFTEVGKVNTVSLITDRNTGQSKGFAFVEMESKEAATAAITRFDGQEALGRLLKVNEARPPERRSGDGRSFGGGRR
jgi:RNA recognition motif-containing protein